MILGYCSFITTLETVFTNVLVSFSFIVKLKTRQSIVMAYPGGVSGFEPGALGVFVLLLRFTVGYNVV